MELIDKAKTVNDFGLRRLYPWTGTNQHAPWTEIVTSFSEQTFVEDLLAAIFHLTEPAIIRRVENPYLWARYVLAYGELGANVPSRVTEHHVIHATSMTNALNIADVNFDWRRVSRARFGKGVSFSPHASYALRYASRKDAYIIAGIPVAKTSEGGYRTTIPGEEYDTTVDSGGNVYVKYYDNDFYPYYIVQ